MLVSSIDEWALLAVTLVSIAIPAVLIIGIGRLTAPIASHDREHAGVLRASR